MNMILRGVLNIEYYGTDKFYTLMDDNGITVRFSLCPRGVDSDVPPVLMHEFRGKRLRVTIETID